MFGKIKRDPITLPGIDWNNGHQKPLILMSLQPRYWQLVLDGTKRYEYRRVFRTGAVQAYIYLSSPRQEVAGFIDFGDPIIDTPHHIAELAEQYHPGSRQSMLKYLQGCVKAFAVPILSYKEITPGIRRSELVERFNFTAPQNYLMLDKYPGLCSFIRSRPCAVDGQD